MNLNISEHESHRLPCIQTNKEIESWEPRWAIICGACPVWSIVEVSGPAVSVIPQRTHMSTCSQRYLELGYFCDFTQNSSLLNIVASSFTDSRYESHQERVKKHPFVIDNGFKWASDVMLYECVWVYLPLLCSWPETAFIYRRINCCLSRPDHGCQRHEQRHSEAQSNCKFLKHLLFSKVSKLRDLEMFYGWVNIFTAPRLYLLALWFFMICR